MFAHKVISHGLWNSRVVSLVSPLLASQSSTRRLAIDFECFCRLLPNYTCLTRQNFVHQHSVMAETTLKQRAFAFNVFDFQHSGIPGFIYVGAVFNAVNITSDTMCGIPPGREVGTVPFILFPRPFCLMQTECSRGIGEGTSVCRFTRMPTWWLRDMLPCLQSPVRVFVLLPMLSSAIYGRMKPYLVVKISSHIVTEHCCQVCILSMMFCCSDCWLCADTVSW